MDLFLVIRMNELSY